MSARRLDHVALHRGELVAQADCAARQVAHESLDAANRRDLAHERGGSTLGAFARSDVRSRQDHDAIAHEWPFECSIWRPAYTRYGSAPSLG